VAHPELASGHKRKKKFEPLLFYFTARSLLSFSFVLIQKKQKIKANPNAPPFCRAPDSYRGHGTSLLLINSTQSLYRILKINKFLVQLRKL